MTAVRPARREDVLELLASAPRALHVNEIATRLNVPPSNHAALHRLLDDLSYDGTVVATTGQRFKLATQRLQERGATVEGFLNANPRGFGFVSAAGLAGDVFIPPEAMRGALHGDKVRVRVISRSSRGLDGEILAIVDRRPARVAGTLRLRRGSGWLEPDDARLRGPIVIRGELPEGAEDGVAAIVKITQFPELADENPEGEIEVVVGDPGDPKVEVAKILLREGIEEDHPPAAVAEAEAYGAEVEAAALVGREDLTGIPLPTIDPEDARDHDDAVWVIRREDGTYKAWIAIADVSHYVKPGTALDAAALGRGNSIYLPDRAIPMLPRALSSNLCSLLPGVVRLCLCVEVELDAAGTVTASRVVEGFMKSAAKLTYPGVARALGFTAEGAESPEATAMRPDLEVMWDLARTLRGRRMRRGALDFDLPEAKVVLDAETGGPLDVQKRSRDPGVAKAYQLVEELMLLANETMASFLVERDVPGIYRNHQPPDEAKLDRFATLCAELDVKFELEDAADPKRLSALLKRVSAHPKKHILHLLLLRAMKQAHYDVSNVGHFGLASTAYLHFTSPIRRYPDLVVHRAVRASLRGDPIDRSETAKGILREAATVASDRERKAMEIEREVVDLHRALLMRDSIGRIFDGTVSSLVGTGVFVTIDEPFVDVLVRMESLGPDRYELDDERLRAIGVRSGDRIGLGDAMRLQIDDVSTVRRTVFGRRVAHDEGPWEGPPNPPGEPRGGAGEERPKRRVKRTGSSKDPKSTRGSTKGTSSTRSAKETKAPKGRASKSSKPSKPAKKEKPRTKVPRGKRAR